MNVKYINIPSNVLFDYRLSAFEKILYGELIVLSYKKGYCDCSNSFLAKSNNCSERNVTRSLSNLNNYGYITIENHSKRKISI